MSNGFGSKQIRGDVPTLLNVRQVAEILGVHERTVWRFASLAEAGASAFPKPIRIAERTVRWREDDVMAYINTLTGEGK
jgi:predicted DNA-binding transcriptional regulator AlpA